MRGFYKIYYLLIFMSRGQPSGKTLSTMICGFTRKFLPFLLWCLHLVLCYVPVLKKNERKLAQNGEVLGLFILILYTFSCSIFKFHYLMHSILQVILEFHLISMRSVISYILSQYITAIIERGVCIFKIECRCY